MKVLFTTLIQDALARGWYDTRDGVIRPRLFHQTPADEELLKEFGGVSNVGVNTAAGIGENRTATAVGDYEGTEAEIYMCARRWQGFHILSRMDESGLKWKLHQDCQKDTVFEIELDDHDPGRFTLKIRSTLRLPELDPYQNELGIFTLDGNRATRKSLRREDAYTLFVTENGMWMWPPVRIGFRHDTGYETSFGKRIFLKVVSVDPVVFEMGQFLSVEQADQIVEEASPHFMQSPVLKQTAHLGNSHSDFRTSEQAWLGNHRSQAATAFDLSVEQITRVPRENNEDLQVLRYLEGQFYHAHSDWLDISLYPEQKQVWLDAHYGYADRLATVFAYFTDSPGGHTIFPNVNGTRTGNFKDCTRGYKSLCKKGHVAMWYNLLPTGRGDPAATHGGCPPENGATKFSANKWVRTKPFRSPSAKWFPTHPRLIAQRLVSKSGQIIGANGEHRDDGDEAVSVQDKINFKNNCDFEVEISWVNGNDKVFMIDVAAGATGALNTVQGHCFSAERKGDPSRMAKYCAKQGQTLAQINPADIASQKSEL